MIEYRSFRNDDPPRVAEAWTKSLAGPRTVSISPKATTLLEYFLLAKPYFDAAGLILALSDGQPVGFVQTGFASNVEGNALDRSVGIVCALGVVPAQRRKGVGSELLRRAEDYLRQHGAKRLVAGSMAPENPFLFGLYGGCDSPGILASNESAEPFFAKHGYTVGRRSGLFRRTLATLQMPTDLRFTEIRQKFEIVGAPLPASTWWREGVLGPVEVFEYNLRDKKTEENAARLLLWDMELFAQAWQESCVGLLDVQVDPRYRRRGLGRYLFAQVLRHLRDQTFSLFEARIDLDNAAGLAFFRDFGFEQVETGVTFQRNA